MATFPPQHCRMVASRSHGDDAYVLMDTGSEGQPYLYGAHCHRDADGWYEGSSSNGPGWCQTGHDPDVGSLAVWGDAVAGAHMVRIEFDGVVIDEPVPLGAFLVVWWRVPVPSEWPRVVAFQVDGRWVPAEGFI